MAKRRGILARVGPAFIVGACVIGPGSVTLMSTTGASYGYAMIWLSLLAGALMAGFLALAMRLGIYSDETFLTLTANRLGRPFAVACGLAIFMVTAAFQFGNSLGVTAGMEALFAGVPQYVWPVAFTLVALAFLFSFKQFYGLLEKMMMFFLVFMALAFLSNLVWAVGAKPDRLDVLQGMLHGAFVPTLPANVNWVVICGLAGTTFCITAAIFQIYLVRAKGWTEDDMASGIADTVMASVMLTLIGAIIMMTAATVLYPHADRVDFGIMIRSLENVFGPYARIVFSVGFWAAAFSSFIANSLTGGVIINDTLGLGGKLESTATKIFASVVLLIGMTLSLAIIHAAETSKTAERVAVANEQAEQAVAQPEKAKKVDIKVAAILVGQASTMLAVPLAAIALVAVLFDPRATKGRTLNWAVKAFVLFGAIVLLGVAIVTYMKIKPELVEILGLG